MQRIVKKLSEVAVVPAKKLVGDGSVQAVHGTIRAVSEPPSIWLGTDWSARVEPFEVVDETGRVLVSDTAIEVWCRDGGTGRVFLHDGERVTVVGPVTTRLRVGGQSGSYRGSIRETEMRAAGFDLVHVIVEPQPRAELRYASGLPTGVRVVEAESESGYEFVPDNGSESTKTSG